MKVGRRVALLVTAVAVGGCTAASSAPFPDPATESRFASPSAPTGNLPPGCEPIELRALDGSLLELDGSWIEQSRDDAGQLRWWIRTQGDCLYGAATVDEVPEEGSSMNPGTVIHYTGKIQPNFTIEGLMLHLGPLPGHAPDFPASEDVRFLIEFADDGTVELREDRQPGAVTGGPRCVEQSFCFPPLVLVPRGE